MTILPNARVLSFDTKCYETLSHSTNNGGFQLFKSWHGDFPPIAFLCSSLHFYTRLRTSWTDEIIPYSVFWNVVQKSKNYSDFPTELRWYFCKTSILQEMPYQNSGQRSWISTIIVSISTQSDWMFWSLIFFSFPFFLPKTNYQRS